MGLDSDLDSILDRFLEPSWVRIRMSESECPNQNIRIRISEPEYPNQNVRIRISESEYANQNVRIEFRSILEPIWAATERTVQPTEPVSTACAEATVAESERLF